MEALKLLSAYSFPPNSRKYCGPECDSMLLEALQGKQADETALKNAFKKFEAMFPYLELIAKANNKGPFDLEIAQAYWEGNSLLENVKLPEWKETAKVLAKNSEWPAKIAEKYSANISPELVPHHSFHVLNSFSNTIEDQKAMLERVNNCIISWGRVLKSDSGELTVVKKPVILNAGHFELGELEVCIVKNQWVSCERNDFVSMHWGFACRKLSPEELANLEKYTLQNLRNFTLL